MSFARLFIAAAFLASIAMPAAAREMESFPVVKLQSLDKITARTMTFEANVGNTVKFGSLYIKIQACSKAPPVEQPESAAFLQIWEVHNSGAAGPMQEKKDEAKWVFSGWMFASSPALSHMDHPVYDVWVLDCLSEKGGQIKKPADAEPGEGEMDSKAAPAAPTDTPPAGNAAEIAPAPEAVPLDSEAESIAPDAADTTETAPLTAPATETVPDAAAPETTTDEMSPLGD